MDTVDGAQEVQRRLNELGFGPLTEDAKPGKLTMSAVLAALVKLTGGRPAPVQVEPVELADPRSEQTLATLAPKARELGRQLILSLNAQGWRFKATSGSRTYAEQDALYEQGRTKPGDIVTNARGGYSNHCFKLAFDLTLFDEHDRPVWDSPLYAKAGVLGKELGLVWGGDWHSQDLPHYEFRPAYAQGMSEGEALAEYRNRIRQGIQIA